MDRIEAARRAYAEELRFVAAIRSEALVRAFATVPRERFLGPGPWLVARLATGEYWQTPDADPVQLYHNVLFAIDAARGLNNGHPEFLATLLESVGIRAGDAVLHIGAGLGYYTAIQAELAGPAGQVTALEIDPELAARAATHLADRPNVAVIAGDGAAHRPAPADVIVVNAGATHPLPAWLDALKPGGRILLPLTTDRGHGIVLRIRRAVEGGLAASAISEVRIYPCAGARKPLIEKSLVQALGGGGQRFIRSLRRDEHAPAETCWLHGHGFCLSTEPPGANGAAAT
jgi:protein-L-isoaspartate(D-aspartate) O-methyltransferase